LKTKLFTLISWVGFLVSAVAEWGLELDLPLTSTLWLVITTVAFSATTTRAALTNNWIDGSGKWEHPPFESSIAKSPLCAMQAHAAGLRGSRQVFRKLVCG
jgi:hypothetical protein